MRDLLKGTARGCALIAVLPFLASYAIRRPLLGADRALEGSSQLLSLVPGLIGIYLRRAFLSQVLASCHASVTVEFGTLFSQTGATLAAGVYVGPHCHLGLVHLGRDVLLAAGVHVPSGARTHGTANVDRAIRDQAQTRAPVRIGEGSWVGSGAVVMADVGSHSVVGAGAVVTHPVPDFVVAAGVPARVMRERRPATPDA